MKKLFWLILALAFTFTFNSSCTKSDEEIFDITGKWKYSGHEASAVEDITILKYYIFDITDSKISIYGLSKVDLTEEYSYTKKGNTITFIPKFLNKYSTAQVQESFGGSSQGMMWDCGNNQIYYFDRTE